MGVRLANASDLEALFALNEAFNGPGVTTRERMRQALERPSGELVFLASVRGAAVGFLCARTLPSMCYEGLQGEITELYVRPECRRMGVAAALMEAAEGALREKGVRELRLLTGADNRGAQALYQKRGFVREDELLFQKKL